MDFGIANIAAITVIAYLAGLAWKTSDKLPDKWIPIMCGVVGMIFGILAFLIKVPDFPGNNIIDAIAIGIVSGFAATGINQIGKQLSKDE